MQALRCVFSWLVTIQAASLQPYMQHMLICPAYVVPHSTGQQAAVPQVDLKLGLAASSYMQHAHALPLSRLAQQVSKHEPEMLRFLEQSAEAYFAAMLASSHSFEKALFYIGLHGRPGTNIVADGAIERTPARVKVLPMGLSGFLRKGDSASYRIKVGLQCCWALQGDELGID